MRLAVGLPSRVASCWEDPLTPQACCTTNASFGCWSTNASFGLCCMMCSGDGERFKLHVLREQVAARLRKKLSPVDRLMGNPMHRASAISTPHGTCRPGRVVEHPIVAEDLVLHEAYSAGNNCDWNLDVWQLGLQALQQAVHDLEVLPTYTTDLWDFSRLIGRVVEQFAAVAHRRSLTVNGEFVDYCACMDGLDYLVVIESIFSNFMEDPNFHSKVFYPAGGAHSMIMSQDCGNFWVDTIVTDWALVRDQAEGRGGCVATVAGSGILCALKYIIQAADGGSQAEDRLRSAAGAAETAAVLSLFLAHCGLFGARAFSVTHALRFSHILRRRVAEGGSTDWQELSRLAWSPLSSHLLHRAPRVDGMAYCGGVINDVLAVEGNLVHRSHQFFVHCDEHGVHWQPVVQRQAKHNSSHVNYGMALLTHVDAWGNPFHALHWILYSWQLCQTILGAICGSADLHLLLIRRDVARFGQYPALDGPLALFTQILSARPAEYLETASKAFRVFVYGRSRATLAVGAGSVASAIARLVTRATVVPRLRVIQGKRLEQQYGCHDVVVFLQRGAAMSRYVTNFGEVLAVADGIFSCVRWYQFPPGSRSGMTATEQVLTAQRSKLLAGPHGGALAFAAFQQPGSIVLEFLPAIPALEAPVLCGHAWDSSPNSCYGAVALAVGVRHACVAERVLSFQEYQQGLPWRHRNITVPIDDLSVLLSQAANLLR
mmetsp:Transcript_17285/g.38106  ORF Transcript_17285/g.38106 Transcript_17285/m.38106 type:complete len:715 (-) Transcript_17285:17-2161(-)